MAYRYPYNDEEVIEYKPAKFNENRSVWKFIILSILTLGLYSIFFFMPFSFELDKIAPKRDGTKTMNFALVYLLALFTASIAMMVWHYHIAERIEEAMIKRGITYRFGTNDFWTYYILGSFFIIGPLIYLYKLCRAMNLLCAAYNKEKGL